MEYQPRPRLEQTDSERAWSRSLVGYEPSPEHLDDLPDPVFNLEQMSRDQIVDLVAGLAKAAYLLTSGEMKFDFEGEQEKAREGQESIHLTDALLNRDIRCLAGRNLEKAEDVVQALATHPDDYARNASPYLLRSLLRFEGDNPEGRQRVFELLTRLTRDDESVVQEGAMDTISDILWHKEVDRPTAQHLERFLHEGYDRPSWIWEE